MKTRNGFVSNSSSSSFIVAGPKDESIEVKIKIDVTKYASFTLTTEEEVTAYFTDDQGFTPEELVTHNNYLDCIEAIKKGKVVYAGHFSDENRNGEETMLCYRGLTDKDMPRGAYVIQADGGY